MSILERISPVKALPKVLSMLVYGRSGTGKTTFSASWPTPTLLIDIREKGTDSIADREGVDVIQCGSWDDLEEIFWYLDSMDKPDYKGKKYKSVVLDQVSSMQDLAMEKAMADEGKEVMSQRLWGVVSGLMKTWLINYRDLTDKGINVLFIAHDRVNKGDSDEDEDALDPQVGARLMPSVAGMLNGAVKAIGNTYVGEVFLEDKSRKIEYRMRLGPHAYYATKLRNPMGTDCPEYVVDPTYQSILSLMAEGVKKPVRRTVTTQPKDKE